MCGRFCDSVNNVEHKSDIDKSMAACVKALKRFFPILTSFIVLAPQKLSEHFRITSRAGPCRWISVLRRSQYVNNRFYIVGVSAMPSRTKYLGKGLAVDFSSDV